MISKESFSREWIFKQREAYPKADPQLIERQIYAFELLGLLSATGKSFVFKGGTSLLLLLPTAHRLSIDVDIVGDFSFEELEQMARDTIFSEVKEDEREPSGIPKKHFKFYYTSVVDNKPSYVLLDVLSSEHGYPKVQQVPIKHHLFNVDEDRPVTIPTIEGIIGDKLTAFAPDTIGVPYGKNKSMEIIKQLFDVGELFDVSDDVDHIVNSYQAIHRQEISFHQKAFSITETAQDTVSAAFLLCQTRLRGGIETDKSVELEKGLRQIQSYMLGIPYRLEEARVSAAKAAFLASSVLSKRGAISLNAIRYHDSMIDEIRNTSLSGDHIILNRLKATNPEAFYYWTMVDSKHLRTK